MSDLTTGYRINEQGMIVEEIEELEVGCSKEKIDPQYSSKEEIPESIAISTSS